MMLIGAIDRRARPGNRAASTKASFGFEASVGSKPVIGAKAVVGAAAVLLLCCGGAQAQSFQAHYSVSLMGLRIGDLYANAALNARDYRMDLNAQLTGLAAMVSRVRMALASTGTINKRGALAPATYATTSANSEETHTLRMALNAGSVRAVEISPPPDYHGERVPVSDANKRNILDPTSALIMPVPMNAPLIGPAACGRTLPVYDGYARFDISLAYVGSRDVQVGSYSGPVAVCSARYHPISGHMVNSRSTAFMAQNTGIEVWLAPLPAAHVVVPLRVTMPTMAGQLDIEAVEFNAASPAQASQ